MELYEITVAGYRKFRKSARLKTHGKLVAILGANEAGKSSLLNAITRVADSEEFRTNEISHETSGDEISVKAKYFLSVEDKEAAQLSDAVWYTVTKGPNGERKWLISPWPTGRDLSHRQKLISTLEGLTTKPKFAELVNDEDTELTQDLKASFEALADSDEDAESSLIESMRALSQRYSNLKAKGLPAYAQELGALIEASIATEAAPNTRLVAGKILWARLPSILLFSSADRDLKSAYAIADIKTEIPQALANLMDVANCDLSALIGAYEAGDQAYVDTLTDRANEKLEVAFRAVWKQSAVSVMLSVRDQTLNVQIKNPDRRRTSFSERSDGLRQFVALQCFTTARGEDKPILLIDEAEQHLHYNAQADLIQMLASQEVSPKIIFTTHSAGCLPEDLGNGVRLVTESSEPEWSEIKNKFWDSNTATFSPLLIGMGASTLAFFPTRLALVVEGESDMLLLPSMMREALATNVVGLQVVPGLSRVEKQRLPMLDTVGAGVCYLVDNDKGGRSLAEDLEKQTVPKDRIFKLDRPGTGDVELEDFIDPEILAAAVNQFSKKMNGTCDLVKSNKIPKYGKWDFIAKSCADAKIPTFQKTDISYSILDVLTSKPGTAILDARLSGHFLKTVEAIKSKLIADN